MDRWKISTGNGLCVQDCRSISYVANLVDQPIKGLEMRMGIAHWARPREGFWILCRLILKGGAEMLSKGRESHWWAESVQDLAEEDIWSSYWVFQPRMDIWSAQETQERKRGCITVRSLGDPVTEWVFIPSLCQFRMDNNHLGWAIDQMKWKVQNGLQSFWGGVGLSGVNTIWALKKENYFWKRLSEWGGEWGKS